MFDLIGDVHGHATPLKNLLHKLGYQEIDGVWRHPDRQVVFLGDLIDRGPEQVETVKVVRRMVEAGTALVVMGNHEFNAVSWATPRIAVQKPGNPESGSTEPGNPGIVDPKPGATTQLDGAFPNLQEQAPEESKAAQYETEFLRAHTPGNRRQHQAFLDQMPEESTLYREAIDWFKTFPVYLDLPGFRVVHACWHVESLNTLSGYVDAANRLLPDAWQDANCTEQPAYESLEVLLKGWEVKLPPSHWFPDQYGKLRSRIRTRWWLQDEATYRALALVPAGREPMIPDISCPATDLPGYDQQKLLFLGHYWLTGQPEPLTEHIACLDYSIASQNAGHAEQGKLCAYRWYGEHQLQRENYWWVEPKAQIKA